MWKSWGVLISCLLFLAAAAVVSAFDPNQQLERDEIINAVNKANTSWEARRNFDAFLKKDIISQLMGVVRRPESVRLPEHSSGPTMDTLELPPSYDTRDSWPNCTGLNTIRDQGSCGSCWAVSAASAFSDRLCIASHGKINLQLSAQQLTSCCPWSWGCCGGSPAGAWAYIKSTGLVTGGDYNSTGGCQPYLVQPCEHHTHGDRIKCKADGTVPTPSCSSSCYNKSYKTPFDKDHHKVKSTFRCTTVREIQQEVFIHGPVQATFAVYEDFLSYSSGVYSQTTGDFLAGHAVKIVGWGSDGDIPYWLVANSWNTNWGDGGYFKILRGSNECSFEAEVLGGYAEIYP